MYKPLPNSLTIQTSSVNGLGLFATENIPQATNLGITHIKIDEQIIRTPRGGFINHADDPNCVKAELLANSYHGETFKKKWNLVTLRAIKKGEELTLKYTFYNV